MKMQNILGALLLAIASRAAYTGDVRVFNTKNKPVKITFVYKNKMRETRVINAFFPNQKNPPHVFTVASQANPVKEIFYNVINENKLWSFPVQSIKKTNYQTISLHNDNEINIQNYYIDPFTDLLRPTGDEWITAKEVHEDV